jgi:hypothetical protein
MGYERKLAVGEPLASPLAGAAPLSPATAELACDSPDEKPVARGERVGSLMFGLIARAIRKTPGLSPTLCARIADTSVGVVRLQRSL